MDEYLQPLVAITSALLIAQRIGKYLDFRIGPTGISALKKKARLERYWSALAKQSMERFAFRMLVAVEHQFSEAFGSKIFSLSSLGRFVIFSIALNFMVAFLTIEAAAPPNLLIPYLVKPKLLRLVGLLVAVNIPLDLAAYVCMRFAIRSAQRKSLYTITATIVGAITASYCMAVLSTTFGGMVTLFSMADWNLSVSNAASLLKSWLPLAIAHPFTSELALNGINVGFVALGAMPSVLVLSVTLTFMIFLSTIAHWTHKEVSLNFGKFLDEKKSFFELMAFLFSVVFSLMWLVLWSAAWLGRHMSILIG